MGRPPVHIIEKNGRRGGGGDGGSGRKEEREKRRKINERENECSGRSDIMAI